MGDWGYKVYENDEAADWFASFWESKDFDLLAQEVEQFDPSEENYDTIRAVAHVLIAFGSPYACPFSFIDRLYPTMQATLVILQNMLTPPNDTWAFWICGAKIRALSVKWSNKFEICKSCCRNEMLCRQAAFTV